MEKRDYVLVLIATIVITYLLFAFSLWNMDASEWTQASRVFCVFSWISFTAIAIMVMEIYR